LAFRRAALLVFLTDRREPFVFVTALVVATLFFFAPLSRAPLLFLAPLRGAPLLFVATLLLETRGVGGARFVGGARRGDGPLGLSSRAFGIGRPIGSGGACRLLRCAHRLLCCPRGVSGALCFRGPIDLGSTRDFLSRAHRFLRRPSGFGRPLAFGGAVRVGALLRLLRHAPDVVAAATSELLELWRAGTIRPHVGAEFPHAEVEQAHALVESRRSVGKVVLLP
jgi:hypothetical protein